MEERRLGRWYDSRTDTEWQVVEWGDVSHVKNIDENRLTQRGIENSSHTVFAIVYPNGDVKHLTWSGVLPDDLDDLVDYWMQTGSL
jgi:hypothetical protein